MKRLISIILTIAIIFLTGFTVIDYHEYEEPYWVAQEFEIRERLKGASNIKPKVDTAIENVEDKGLHMKDVKILISPYKYEGINGAASELAMQILIANDDYDTIYHELGHMYSYHNLGIITKYKKEMEKYYPGYQPKGNWWQKSISEDFAEEFKSIFTRTPKKTNYPDFPNFYEWLLKNTQQIEVTRKEAFDKLGGTKELIDQGIVIGNTKGDYMLDKTLTRAELATVLVRIKGLNKEKKVPFTDIKNKWYEPYVRKIYNEGLIKGYPDNTFRGNNKITRYELHLILERLNTQK